MPITKTCQCGNTFESYVTGKNGALSDQKKYCSVSCVLKFSKPCREVKCAECGTVFLYHGRGRCYRCPKCRKKRNVERASIWQKQNRTANPGVGSGGVQWGKNNHQWKGGLGKKKYKGNYRSRCLRVWGDICVVCGEPIVEVHHIDGDPNNFLPENLVPLCSAHHWKVHRKRKLTPEQLTARLFDIWPEGRIKIAELSEKLSNETTRTEGQLEVDQGQRIAGEKI